MPPRFEMLKRRLHLFERDLAVAPSRELRELHRQLDDVFLIRVAITGTSRPRSVTTATPMLRFQHDLVGRHVDGRVELRNLRSAARSP
jgi:hypothetical protein